MTYLQDIQTFRVFVATWNVGGKSPHSGLNLDDFLHVHDQTDIYVLGFQETVPLNVGNVLVMEDNGPAAKWLSLINQSLNNGYANNKTISNFDTNTKFTTTGSYSGSSSSFFFPRTCLKSASKNFRPEGGRKVKNCNCSSDLERKYNSSKEKHFKCQPSNIREIDISSDDDEDGSDCYTFNTSSTTNKMKYCLMASKQMVGIFVAVWIKEELVQQIGHLRISCVTRGIMGCFGNKGCIAVSMSFHQTSFCFICSHLASGEKEGDELRRNSDVIEILKNTQFPKICKAPNSRIPEKILEHDRIIWFGDLNYRIALDYTETRKLLEDNNWDALLNKDQLKIEREAGRVFEGWKEGKIYFAPTYKYYYNSDAYAGHTINSRSKRRTPAWCDRILWHGDGIRQLSYVRRESQFSDHRPVCATFLVDVVIADGGTKKGLSWVI